MKNATVPLFSLLSLFALCFALASPARSATGTPAGGSVRGVIAPGETHDNGDVKVTNDATSHSNAQEDPWSNAEPSSSTHVTTGQQFSGKVERMGSSDSLTLGSRSGSQATPVEVSGGGGTTTMGSDTWAHFTNNGTGTVTAKDVAGNILATFGPGESGTVHHP